MPIETLTWLMFGALFVLLLTGYPLAFLVGGLSVVFIAWLWSPDALALVPQRVWNNMTQYLLAAIPLFIFMASMLEKSGVIEEVFDVAYKWLGRIPGGLAVATVVAWAPTATSSSSSLSRPVRNNRANRPIWETACRFGKVSA